MKRLLFLLAVTACGGKSAQKPVDHHEHGGAMPELAKFHDVLAPRWHAEKGDKRMADTCAAIGDFHANADALAKATPPAGHDAGAWASGAKELQDAVSALDATCVSKDAQAFEVAFAAVHEHFHHLAEAGGEHHEEHGEHGEEHGEHEEHH